MDVKVIKPQAGYQMDTLSSPADIVIGGAAAGVGKTFTLLLESLRNIHVDGFGGVIFRRTSPQIRNEGGLWDTSMNIYPHVKATPRESFLEWIFPKGAKLKFSHLQHEKDKLEWQGAQIPFIGFDELTHFSRSQFFYLLSRNRSVCGVKPYVRATCNPDPDSWVAEFITWWIDPETGFPIPERNGKVRWMVRDGDNFIWGDNREEVIDKAWHVLEGPVTKSGLDVNDFVKSATFISGSIYDNKELLKVDPSYLANLMAQDAATKSALLDGNWKVPLSLDDIYNYAAFRSIFDNVFDIPKARKYITADIAMQGSDKFVVWVWHGKEIIDCLILDKNNGKQVVEAIKELARKHGVQNRDIVYDNDGVGSFIGGDGGFISGALPFNNGASPLPSATNPQKDPKTGKLLPENYKHLKAQCFYLSGSAVEKGEYKISEEVANLMYDDKMTIRQRLLYERKAIKKAKQDIDKRLCINSKAEQKAILNGESPDLMDAFMMREYFDLLKQPETHTRSVAPRGGGLRRPL